MTDYLKRFSLEGKTAIACGGVGLIGKEISKAFAQAGANVIIADINKTEGIALADELCKSGHKAQFWHFDITKCENFKDEIAKISKTNGPIHTWAITAYPRTKDWGDKIRDIPTKSWQSNVDMHLNGYCFLIRAAAEHMKEHGIKGSIIAFGSTYGVVGPDFNVYADTTMTMPAAYAAIKGGIVNFCRYAASWYGPNGIRVNCLCPGGIFDNQNNEFVKRYEERTALKRMGNPEDIAGATLFLASDAASYITGTTFMVDGGWTCI